MGCEERWAAGAGAHAAAHASRRPLLPHHFVCVETFTLPYLEFYFYLFLCRCVLTLVSCVTSAAVGDSGVGTGPRSEMPRIRRHIAYCVAARGK